MKHAILLLLIAMVSCAKPVDRARASIEQYMIPKMDDPDSYEFVSLTVMDTVTYGEVLNVYGDEELTEYSKESLARYVEYAKSGYTDWSEEIEERKAAVVKDSMRMITARSLAESLKDQSNTPLHYYYEYSFRAKNRLGATILNTYYVELSPEFEVGQFMEEDKLMFDASKIPGFTESVGPYME